MQAFLRNIFGTLILGFTLVSGCSGQEVSNETSPTSPAPVIKIKNFGQMDARFYRGAQPKPGDYKALADLGIKTVIDLREDTEQNAQTMVESLGMKYVNIPMIAKKYPTPQATEQFLKTVNDPETGKFYVHCAGGRHRTGAMGAVYRFELYKWDFDKVYKEMKQYDFYTSWGHGAFKDFVRDYSQRVLEQTKPAVEQK
jgi:protein tyrosine/serine phosphatase